VAGHARVGVEDRTETLVRVAGLFERVLSVAEELALLHGESLEGLAELALRVEASGGGPSAEQGESAGDEPKEQEEGAVPAARPYVACDLLRSSKECPRRVT
jgi:hypothetical protein